MQTNHFPNFGFNSSVVITAFSLSCSIPFSTALIYSILSTSLSIENSLGIFSISLITLCLVHIFLLFIILKYIFKKSKLDAYYAKTTLSSPTNSFNSFTKSLVEATFCLRESSNTSIFSSAS